MTHGENNMNNNMKNDMICTYCGMTNPPNSRFCSKCGRPLTNYDAPRNMAPQMNSQNMQRNMAPQNAQAEGNTTDGGGKKSHKGLVIGLSAAAAVLVIAICFVVIKMVVLPAMKNQEDTSAQSAKQVVDETEGDTNEADDKTAGNKEDADKTEAAVSSSEATTEISKETEAASTEDALISGGAETGYTKEELVSAAENYCKLVYCISNPSIKAGKPENDEYVLTVSATIDGHTGKYGEMTIDRLTGKGTGCRGEKADLFDIDTADMDVYYIIPYSDSRYLGESDLLNLSSDELTLARNEIYARHGRIFKDKDIRTYFEKQVWYAGVVPADEFDESVFSKIERSNISAIKEYEDKLENGGIEDAEGYNGDYIIPDSSTRKLSGNDLAGMDARTLMLARNEIYARHGRKFNDSEIREYFESKSWYVPSIEPSDFSEDMLSDIEKTNIALIKPYED